MQKKDLTKDLYAITTQLQKEKQSVENLTNYLNIDFTK